MNDQCLKEISSAAAENSADKSTFLAEIERLFIAGYRTRRIAEMLGADGYRVGRNLREIRKRWVRAGERQRDLAPTRCATVYEQAMDGWQRSQLPKQTTTNHSPTKAENAKTVTRREEGPGDKTFLQAAVSALKALRQFVGENEDSPPKTRQMTDRDYLILLRFLTQEQVDRLDDEQLARIREAMENLRAEVDAARREEEIRKEESSEVDSGSVDPAGLPASDQVEVPGEHTPPSPGSDAGPQPEPASDIGTQQP
jgi:hypothetical protein